MKRRDFIAAMGGLFFARPRVVWAQSGSRMPRVIAWIGTNRNDPEFQLRAGVFRDTMRELGWTDGRNARIDLRWSYNSPEDIRAAAAEFASLNPDVIVVAGAPLLAAVHAQTKTIPIVFVLVTDPVKDGFVASLAWPGGNITGFTIFEHTFAGKWLEMLKEVVPKMARWRSCRLFASSLRRRYGKTVRIHTKETRPCAESKGHPAVVRMEARLLRRLEHWIALQSDSPDLIRQTARPRYITWPDPLFPFSVAATATP